MKVVFYTVKKPFDKVINLIKCAKEHFESQRPLLFLVSDQKSAEFVDHILWQNAAFLPHCISESITDELIVIAIKPAQQKEAIAPLNQAKQIFNLTPEPIRQNFQTIYEFDDSSNLQKKALSKKKFIFYHGLKIQIEAK